MWAFEGFSVLLVQMYRVHCRLHVAVAIGRGLDLALDLEFCRGVGYFVL